MLHAGLRHHLWQLLCQLRVGYQPCRGLQGPCPLRRVVGHGLLAHVWSLAVKLLALRGLRHWGRPLGPVMARLLHPAPHHGALEWCNTGPRTGYTMRSAVRLHSVHLLHLLHLLLLLKQLLGMLLLQLRMLLLLLLLLLQMLLLMQLWVQLMRRLLRRLLRHLGGHADPSDARVHGSARPRDGGENCCGLVLLLLLLLRLPHGGQPPNCW